MGGSITAGGNVATDLAFGNMPKFENAGDVLKYGAFKALDGLGAAGAGQLAKSGYNALLRNWLQEVSINGTAQIASRTKDLMGVLGSEWTITQTAV